MTFQHFGPPHVEGDAGYAAYPLRGSISPFKARVVPKWRSGEPVGKQAFRNQKREMSTIFTRLTSYCMQFTTVFYLEKMYYWHLIIINVKLKSYVLQLLLHLTLLKISLESGIEIFFSEI
jgi:hypothetical protein